MPEEHALNALLLVVLLIGLEDSVTLAQLYLREGNLLTEKKNHHRHY